MASPNPLVVHIVLFQWTDAAAPEAIEKVMHELRLLKDKLPGILDLTCGKNFTNRAGAFTHALVVHFTDRAALEAYGPHPEHQRVVQEYVNPIRAELLALDYEL